MNADMKEWASGIVQALEILVAEGAERMSQSALAELAVRQEDMHIRTGESGSAIRWNALTDMGDVSAQKLAIGCLDFSVLDYGDRLHITMDAIE